MRAIALLPAVLFTTLLPAQQRKVLIIGIDGCRGDAIVAANCPNLDALAATGIASFEGNTHPPTWSATGWSSMLTGVWEQKHKAVENSFANNQFATWPHFFARLKSVDPTISLHSIVHWAPINSQITTQADQELTFTTDQAVADAAVNLLQNGDPDVVFLHFDDVDHAGHSFGFSPATPQYLAAIELVDQQIGPVIQAVTQRPVNEEWMIIATTDHGGDGTNGHGGISFNEQRIFTFVSGDGIAPTVRTADRDTLTAATCISFGTGRHVRVANPAPYQFGATQDFTVECRVKMPTTWSSDPVFVGNKNWNSGLNAGFVISTTGSGFNWKFNIGDGVDRIDLNGLPINDNQWHHLAVTCDRDGEARIFQDGLLLRSVSMTAIGDVNNLLQLCFGQDGTTAYATSLTGSMSEVRIWNAALPIETVSSWSGKTLNPSHPNSANLIGHWRLNEGTGGALTNQVATAPAAQHYTGTTMSNATWTANALPLITTDLTGTVCQTDLVPTVLSYLCVRNDPAWQLDGRSLIPVCAPVTTDLRVFLAGPYVPATGTMNDALRVNDLVPLTEPYTALGYDHTLLGGTETAGPAVFDPSGDDAVVDWIVLEQRSPADPTRVTSSRSALLQRDGDVVDVDGSSPVQWPALLGLHHVAVHHRTHLGAMTAQPIPFVAGGTTSLDLTDPGTALFGTQAMNTVAGVRLLWPGDANADRSVLYTGTGNDRDRVLVRIGGVVPTNTVSGYHVEDINLDGEVKYTGSGNDRDLILNTIGGVVPTAEREAQLP